MNGKIKEMTRIELETFICEKVNEMKVEPIKKELLKRLYISNTREELSTIKMFDIKNVFKGLNNSRVPERFVAINFRKSIKKIAKTIFGEKESSQKKYDCKTFDEFANNFPENKIFYKLVNEYFLYIASIFCDEPYIDKNGEEWYLVAKNALKIKL
jgi:hypothetical protein